MILIINIEKSPLRNKRYRIYLINGDHYDIGFNKCSYYIDNKDKVQREMFFQFLCLDKNTMKTIQQLKPSQVLYESFILNGPSKNLINNINFFNKEILKWNIKENN